MSALGRRIRDGVLLLGSLAQLAGVVALNVAPEAPAWLWPSLVGGGCGLAVGAVLGDLVAGRRARRRASDR